MNFKNRLLDEVLYELRSKYKQSESDISSDAVKAYKDAAEIVQAKKEQLREYPYAVVATYSYDAGSIKMFRTKKSAREFIRKTMKEKIKNEKEMGYSTMSEDDEDVPQTYDFTYARENGNDFFELKEIDEMGNRFYSKWELFDDFEVAEPDEASALVQIRKTVYYESGNARACNDFPRIYDSAADALNVCIRKANEYCRKRGCGIAICDETIPDGSTHDCVIRIGDSVFAAYDIVPAHVEKGEKLFEIWQMKDEPALKGFKYDIANSSGRVKMGNYNLVYKAPLGNENLNSLFYRFNVNHPEDYEAPSLSVSDVIVITDGRTSEANFVEPVGFKEIEFV